MVIKCEIHLLMLFGLICYAEFLKHNGYMFVESGGRKIDENKALTSRSSRSVIQFSVMQFSALS